MIKLNHSPARLLNLSMMIFLHWKWWQFISNLFWKIYLYIYSKKGLQPFYKQTKNPPPNTTAKKRKCSRGVWSPQTRGQKDYRFHFQSLNFRWEHQGNRKREELSKDINAKCSPRLGPNWKVGLSEKRKPIDLTKIPRSGSSRNQAYLGKKNQNCEFWTGHSETANPKLPFLVPKAKENPSVRASTSRSAKVARDPRTRVPTAPRHQCSPGRGRAPQMTLQSRISTPKPSWAFWKHQARDQDGKNRVGWAAATSATWRTSETPSLPECSQRKAVTTLRHLYPKIQGTAAHMRTEARFFSFPLPAPSFLSLWLEENQSRSRGMLGIVVLSETLADSDLCACSR